MQVALVENKFWITLKTKMGIAPKLTVAMFDGQSGDQAPVPNQEFITGLSEYIKKSTRWHTPSKKQEQKDEYDYIVIFDFPYGKIKFGGNSNPYSTPTPTKNIIPKIDFDSYLPLGLSKDSWLSFLSNNPRYGMVYELQKCEEKLDENKKLVRIFTYS